VWVDVCVSRASCGVRCCKTTLLLKHCYFHASKLLFVVDFVTRPVRDSPEISYNTWRSADAYRLRIKETIYQPGYSRYAPVQSSRAPCAQEVYHLNGGQPTLLHTIRGTRKTREAGILFLLCATCRRPLNATCCS